MNSQQQPRLTRAQRRAAQRRAAQRNGQHDGESQTGRSLSSVADQRERAARRAGLIPPRAPRLHVFGGAVMFTAGVFTVLSMLLFSDSAIMSGEFIGWVCAGLAMAIGGVWAMRRGWNHVRRTTRRAGGAVMAAVILFSSVGLLTQDSLDGDPVFTGSGEARATREVRGLLDDLDTLVAADALLTLSLDQVRVRTDELGDVRNELLVIVERRGTATMSNSNLAEASRATVQSADAGALALEAAVQLAAQFDDRLYAEASDLRTTMVSEALRAGQLTRLGAEEAGVGELIDAPVRE